jgi:hypothetical protein
VLGRVHAITKQVGMAGAADPRLRNELGDSPTMSLNVRLNVPMLEKPTSKQMSATLRVEARRRYIARSTRRRCR